jgi:SAM-dependent methyltransferase
MKKAIFRSPMIAGLRASLHERGIIKTFLVTYSYFLDFFFDINYGTDTFSWLEVERLDVDDEKKEHTERYQQTHAIPLRKLLKELKIPPDNVLVDLGCGKGRVLLISSEFGFREVRGIEFSDLLCDIAQKNCSLYKARKRIPVDFDIIKSDVIDYKMKDDEGVFFLFNPFDAYILEQVLQNILASLKRRNRRIWIIYNNPVHRELMENLITPAISKDFTIWGQQFTVFEAGLAAPLLGG